MGRQRKDVAKGVLTLFIPLSRVFCTLYVETLFLSLMSPSPKYFRCLGRGVFFFFISFKFALFFRQLASPTTRSIYLFVNFLSASFKYPVPLVVINEGIRPSEKGFLIALATLLELTTRPLYFLSINQASK